MCNKQTNYASKDEQNAEITYKIGNKGLSCLGMPHEGNALIGDKMEEEI